MSSPDERRVLLLQGPPSSFFRVLRRAFRDAGIPAHRVVLHLGDRMRAGGDSIPFRGRLAEFDGFLDALIARERITDVLYYADRVPYHRIAQTVAERRGAMPYAVENGYLRPDWLTLEPGGMGAYSRFPVERARIEAIAAGAPAVEETVRYRHGFATEAFHEVSHNLAEIASWPLYRHYERDRPHHPLAEYVSWLPQLVRRQIAERRAPGQMRQLLEGNTPFFLFPMQLQEDYQIRHNSRYGRLSELIHEVFDSFARTAPRHVSLLVKIHPLDNGLENWQRVLKRAKRDYGLTGRIRLMSVGPLAQMLAHCEGVVLVNSTVGLTAIRSGRPVKALGAAIYDLPGLTAQQPLDAFWSAPEAPDAQFVDAFVRAIARTIQLRGSFYDPAGMEAGAEEIVRRVAAGVGHCDWFEARPPRLARAISQGVPADPAPALDLNRVRPRHPG